MHSVIKIFAAFIIFSFVMTSAASANIAQLKVYRKVFPDYKPKCSYCHVDEKPKKEDGGHDLNAYGEKLLELMNGEALTEEMVTEAGDHETFLENAANNEESEVTVEDAERTK